MRFYRREPRWAAEEASLSYGSAYGGESFRQKDCETDLVSERIASFCRRIRRCGRKGLRQEGRLHDILYSSFFNIRIKEYNESLIVRERHKIKRYDA